MQMRDLRVEHESRRHTQARFGTQQKTERLFKQFTSHLQLERRPKGSRDTRLYMPISLIGVALLRTLAVV